MKRSQINAVVRSAMDCFEANGWALPPEPRWDVTDYGLGDLAKWGLVLVHCTSEQEVSERLLYAREGMVTPAHAHLAKKEILTCRWGVLGVQLWADNPEESWGKELTVRVNGEYQQVVSGDLVALEAGESLVILPGVFHEFSAASPEVILSEVATNGRDADDCAFVNPDAGLASSVEEDELPAAWLEADRRPSESEE